MDNTGTNEKSRAIRLIFILITSAIAVIIVSLTVGRDLYEGKGQSLFSFGLIHFSGYLFFLLMPVEMAFVYYLSYFPELQLTGVALATAISAQILDYLIGYSFSPKFLRNVVGMKRIERIERYIQQYGNLTIFIFNILPLSSPVLALVAGMLRVKFKNIMLYSIIGLALKYFLLSLLYSLL